MLNWSDHEGEDEEKGVPQVFGMIVWRVMMMLPAFSKLLEMHAVPSPITGTFMPPSNKPDLDDTRLPMWKSPSDSETTGFASCVSSVKSSSSKTNEHLASASSSVDFKTVSKTADQKPSSTIDDPSFSFKENNCDFSRAIVIPRAAYVPTGSRNPPASGFAGSTFPAGSRNLPASVSAGRAFPAGSRNRPAIVSADRHVPAGSSTRPASVSAGRPFSAGWRNHAARPMTRPTSHYFQHFRRPGCYNQLYMDEREDGELLLRPQQVVLGKLKGHICSRDPR
ncbi:hypothetical protein Tco_0573602, partial [Tanacetum coccineum]